MLQKYQPLNLIERLQSFRNQEFTGLICLRSGPNCDSAGFESYFISFLLGEINYIGTVAPDVDAIAEQLSNNLEQPFFTMGFKIAREQCKGSSSPRTVLSKVTSTRIMTWQKIEGVMLSQASAMLKRLAQAPGTLTSKPDAGSDLCFGEDGHCLDWAILRESLERELSDSSSRSSDSQPDNSQQDSAPSRSLSNSVQEPLRTDLKAPSLPPPAEPEIGNIDINKNTDINTETEKEAVANGAVTSDNSHSIRVAGRPTVLSVDDSPIVQKMIQRTLSSTCNLLLADNALLALRMLKERDDIALVLLDVNMPGVSGLDFCRTLRGIPKFKQLPVIMLTANEGRVSKAMGQIAGSTLYLNKPVDGPKLISVVQQYTQNRVSSNMTNSALSA